MNVTARLQGDRLAPLARRTPEFVGALARHSPRPIPVDADAIDLETAPIT
jgi:hypothetical protein